MRFSFVLWIFCLFVVLGSTGPQFAFASASGLDQLQPLKDPQLDAARAITPTANDVLALTRALAKSGHSEVTDILAGLKKNYPDFFNYYVLNYNSHSLQGSSRASPRVILHGNGNLLLTFNGNAADRGYQTLEMIEFKGDTGYEFRSLHFGHGTSATDVGVSDIEESIGSVQISKPNPQACLTCHGSENPKPIWDPYVIWGGFYGGDDDGLFTYGRAKSDYSSFPGPDLETTAWKDFKSSAHLHPRYQFLTGVITSSHVLGHESDRINLNFNKLLSYQMAARLLIGLEKNETALEILGASAGCSRQYLLPAPAYSENRTRLQKLLEFQLALFSQGVSSPAELSPTATEFMTGEHFVSKMTLIERTLKKYAQRDLRQLSYSRTRDLDLQDGGGGLRYLSPMARSLLKANFGHDVDFHNCESILKQAL
jgi:hypothetical protein